MVLKVYFQWCTDEDTNNFFRFDFLLEEYKLIIELDGQQHFYDIKKWDSKYEDVQKCDIYKMKCAIMNNYSIIRLKQDDVFSNKNEWDKKLMDAIKKYESPISIFICKDSSYEKYINHFDYYLLISK